MTDAFKQPPASLDKLQELVGYQLRAGAFEAASTVLQAFVDEHPDEPWPQYELCRCLLRLQRTDEADALLTRMAEASPDDAQVPALQALKHQVNDEADQAKALYLKALEQDDSLIWAAYNLARLAVALQDDTLCETWLDHIVKQDPEYYPARFERALLYSRTARPTECREELTETINANPLMMQPYLILSELHLREGTAADGIQTLIHGLQANPLAHPLREALARLFTTVGDMQAAFGVRLELCRIRGTAEDFVELGLAALLNNSKEHAVVAFSKALQKNPKDWRSYYNLAELHRASGDYAGAWPLYEQALRHGPCDIVYNGAALWHLEADRAEAEASRAKHYLQKALDVSPDMPEALHNMVLANAAMGLDQDAKDALASFQERVPEGHPLREAIPTLQEAVKEAANAAS
jgi:tetratricopeptide (TPR) repeat protein